MRLVDEAGAWAVVMSGPCPWCVLDLRHGHLLRDDGSAGPVVLTAEALGVAA